MDEFRSVKVNERIQEGVNAIRIAKFFVKKKKRKGEKLPNFY